MTFDELRRVVRKKLKMKKSELSDERLEALWVVLDADESNTIMPDEMAGFLKGKLDSFLRKKMPDIPLPGVNRSLRQRQAKQEAEAATRMGKLAAVRAAELEEISVRNRQWHVAEAARKQREAERKAQRRAIAQEHQKYKRRVLGEMRTVRLLTLAHEYLDFLISS